MTFGSSEFADQFAANFFGRVAGQDAAIYHRLRGLRERIVGVPRAEPRGYACGVHHRVIEGIGGHLRRRGVHIQALEIFARYGIQFEGKGGMLEAPQRIRQMVNGVIRNGP